MVNAFQRPILEKIGHCNLIVWLIVVNPLIKIILDETTLKPSKDNLDIKCPFFHQATACNVKTNCSTVLHLVEENRKYKSGDEKSWDARG